jgi:hypothetical protein
MLEGFLQSVRAMLDVSLDDPENTEPGDVPDEVIKNLAAESNAHYQPEDQQDDLPDQLQEHGQDRDHASMNDQDENFRKGFLFGFRKKIKRWINRVSDFLIRKT